MTQQRPGRVHRQNRSAAFHVLAHPYNLSQALPNQVRACDVVLWMHQAVLQAEKYPEAYEEWDISGSEEDFIRWKKISRDVVSDSWSTIFPLTISVRLPAGLLLLLVTTC